MSGIDWRKGMDEASREVKGGTRLQLLFFHHPECEGSRKTFEETFVDKDVQRVMERETAPVKYDTSESADMAERYRVNWTPAFIIVGDDGTELARWEGYLPPAEFIAELTLSKGLAAFRLKRYGEALREFEMLAEEHPESDLVPEAEYYRAISSYKKDGVTDALARVCHEMMEKHPESIWAKRCSIWSRLPNKGTYAGFYTGGGSLGSGAY